MTSILKADTIQDTDGNNIINESGNTITIGASGDTITIPAGATITNSGTATGFGESNKPAFLATMSAQSVADNTYTKLQYATEVVDTNSAYDNSSNYRFTVPSGEGGVYYFTAMMQSGGMVTNSRAQIVFAKNGSRDSTTMARDYAPTNSTTLYCTASSVLSLSAGDYVEVEMLQASGSTQSAGYGQFGGFKICSV
jgi:hypothetical protein